MTIFLIEYFSIYVDLLTTSSWCVLDHTILDIYNISILFIRLWCIGRVTVHRSSDYYQSRQRFYFDTFIRSAVHCIILVREYFTSCFLMISSRYKLRVLYGLSCVFIDICMAYEYYCKTNWMSPNKT